MRKIQLGEEPDVVTKLLSHALQHMYPQHTLGGWWRQSHLRPAHDRWSPQTSIIFAQLQEVNIRTDQRRISHKLFYYIMVLRDTINTLISTEAKQPFYGICQNCRNDSIADCIVTKIIIRSWSPTYLNLALVSKLFCAKKSVETALYRPHNGGW